MAWTTSQRFAKRSNSSEPRSLTFKNWMTTIGVTVEMERTRRLKSITTKGLDGYKRSSRNLPNSLI